MSFQSKLKMVVIIPVSVGVVNYIKHALRLNDHFADYNFISGNIFHNFEIQVVIFSCFVLFGLYVIFSILGIGQCG